MGRQTRESIIDRLYQNLDDSPGSRNTEELLTDSAGRVSEDL